MTAAYIQCADKAGLCMTEINGEINWIGTSRQWTEFHDMLEWVEQNNSYPWVLPF